MWKLILYFIGILLMFQTVFYKREEYCKLTTFSKDWWIVIILFLIGFLLTWPYIRV